MRRPDQSIPLGLTSGLSECIKEKIFTVSVEAYHKVFIIVFFVDIDDCDPRNALFSQEGVGSWTEFGYCGQHGTCVDGVNKYSCRCDPGWNGTKCEIGMS